VAREPGLHGLVLLAAARDQARGEGGMRRDELDHVQTRRAMSQGGQVHPRTVDYHPASALNVGMHWKLNESVTLLGSIGHEFGTHSDDRHDVLFYLGA
jgi:hypothetical protein